MTVQLGKQRIRIIDSDEMLSGSQIQFWQALRRFQYRTLWTYAANSILGLWLICNPFIYDYKRSTLGTSDFFSGLAIILVECLSFSPGRYALRWLTPAIGFWLLFAPLIFWAPSPASYLNDTLVACLLMAFSILIPSAPGQGCIEKSGPDQPPDWSYNPSSWIRRWLGIALALVGFFISRYLAARQLGYFPHAWDPFFGGDSTDHVLHSTVSRSFPISDAGFGAATYLLEVLAGLMGDRARWRTSPWVVATFAILVVPLGVTSIMLVILQPTVVGFWCGLCLIAAVGLLISVPLAVHEIIAMGLFLARGHEQGKNVWSLFWKGGSIEGGGCSDPDRTDFSIGQRWIASVQGVTIPWMLTVQAAIGTWLMCRPDVLQVGTKASANCDHLLGAVILTLAAVATAEVTRTARLINIPVGLLLILASFLFSTGAPSVFWSELACGLLLAFVSIPRGEIIERYGGWDKFIK
jgi:hypothetical protein